MQRFTYPPPASDYNPTPPQTPGFHVPLGVLRSNDYNELPLMSPAASKGEFFSTQRAGSQEEPLTGVNAFVGERPRKKGWLPLPLRSYWIVPWIVLNALAAIGCEILLYYNNKSLGWGVVSQDAMFSSAHFIYVVPPAALALTMTGGWTYLDSELKKLQPYVTLSEGGGTSSQTVLLDYGNYNKFIAWLPALYYHHYAAFLSTIVTLLITVVSPLASGYFVVRNTELMFNATIMSYGVVGLDPDYETLTPFVTAAGYAEASALYNLNAPPFVKDGWTVGEFEIPQNLSGTIEVNTVAFLTTPNCATADTVTLQSDDTGYNLYGTWGNCTTKIDIHTASTIQYGVNIVSGCSVADSRPDMFKPVAFWIMDVGGTQPQKSMTFCDPVLELHNVSATADLATGLLLNATITGAYTGVNNVTGAPMNLQPFNGIAFNLTNPDQYVLARANATQSGLPGAIYQAAAESDAGLLGTFALGPDGFLNLTDKVYSQYLALVAKEVYFVESDAEVPAIVTQIVPRLWITPYAAHSLAGVLLFAACLGTTLNVLHRQSRRRLYLPVPPGTIGVTASMSRELEKILHGVEDKGAMEETLRNRRFRLDERGIIVVE